MGKRTGEIQKKAYAWRVSGDECQEPGCGQKVYKAKGKKLTRCAKHAEIHDEKEAIRKKSFTDQGLCSECKEHRALAPGLATCLDCGDITGDAVEDCYPYDPSKKSKIKSYAKMSRAGYDPLDSLRK